MRNPTFLEVWEPEELAEDIRCAYRFSPDFGKYLARFLDQAPTNPGGRYRTLEEYVALLVKRLGWSRPHARMFVAGECPASLIPPDFKQTVIDLGGWC